MSLWNIWNVHICYILHRSYHAVRQSHMQTYFFIVAFLENTTIGYSLESLCVCVCVCATVFVCVCVFLHDNSKRNRSRNTKSEYIVVYENSSDEFDIHRIKVKVTVGVQKFSPFTTIQTVRSYSSTLVQARNLILSIYLHRILVYKINECRYA